MRAVLAPKVLDIRRTRASLGLDALAARSPQSFALGSNIAHPRCSKARVGKNLLKGLLVAGLLAALLFAHGCHGNEDHELFGACLEWLGK